MTTENYEIFMAVFPTEDGAQGAVDELEAMAKTDTIEIVDAAVIVRDAEGKTSIDQYSLPSVKKGAKWGAIVGGVVGLVFPPSIIAGALIGAGIGAGGAKIAEVAMESDELKEAAEDLEPGTSAFIAVVDNKWVTQVSRAMKGYSKLGEHALDAEAAARLGILTDEDAGVVAEYGRVAGVDPETGAAVAAEAAAIADTETGDVVAAGTVAAVDPESGEAAVSSFAAAGNVADEALESGSDDDAEADSSGDDSEEG